MKGGRPPADTEKQYQTSGDRRKYETVVQTIE